MASGYSNGFSNGFGNALGIIDNFWCIAPRRLHREHVWATQVWPPFPASALVPGPLVVPPAPPIAIGNSNDMVSRLTRLLPTGWWNDGSFNKADASFINAIKGGLGDGLAWIYSLLQYVKNQTRLTTSSDFFLDLSAYDFFGLRIKRKPSQTDSSLIATIQKEIFRERVTRHGVEQAIEDLTQNEATIFEPMNPQDSGGWGVAFAFDAGGAWGDDLPYTMFITAIEPVGAGIPSLAGFDSYPGGWGVPQGVTSAMLGVPFSKGFSNGFGFLYLLSGTGGSFAFADLSQIQGTVTNQDIYDTIEATRAAGVTCWVNITTPAINSGKIGINFTIGETPIADNSHTSI